MSTPVAPELQPATQESAAPRVRERRRLPPARRAIAQAMSLSMQQAPHFYAAVEVDMSRVVRDRAQWKHSGREAPSVNDCVIAAAAQALRENPLLNSQLEGDQLTVFEDIHIGMVTAVEDKLLVPVIRHADRLGVHALAAASRQLADQARSRKLLPEQCHGGTFSVSNLGMFGISRFTAIINPGQAAILAVGAVEQRAVVVDGAVLVRPTASMTLSVDHRVGDGIAAARFLASLRRHLNDPLPESCV